MKFAAQREGRITRPVTLRINPGILCFDEIVFCPTMANRKDAQFFSLETAIEQELIDFNGLYGAATSMGSVLPEEVKKYEILIPNCIPPSFIQF